MAVNRFGGSFNVRTDILDNITPNNVVQSNVSAPAGEWKPANWLPTEWQGEASKDYFVISSGKVVCFTSDGYIAPAGYNVLAAAVEHDGTFIQYTQNDVDAGVTDITTGEPLTATATHTGADVATGLLSRGLVLEGELALEADDAASTSFNSAHSPHVQAVIADFFSNPVGVCAYDVYVYSGQPQDGDMNFTNYSKQHLVQFLTDVQMQLPHMTCNDSGTTVPEVVESADLSGATEWSAGSDDGEVFPDPDTASAVLLVLADDLATLNRYSGVTGLADLNVVAFGLQGASAGVCEHTDRSEVANGTGDLLVRRRSGISKIKQAGDWWLDPEVGLLFVFSDGGATNPAAAGDTVTYSTYEGVGGSATTVANNHRYTHFVGKAKPGDRVTFDQRANMVAADGNTAEGDVIGRVLQVIKQPRGLLDRVRTAWEGSNFAKDAQMPGTATKGFTDLLTLSDDGTSDEVVIVNVKAR